MCCCTYAILIGLLIVGSLTYVGDPQGTLFEIPRVRACGVFQRPIDSLAPPGDLPLACVFTMIPGTWCEEYAIRRAWKTHIVTPSFFSSCLVVPCDN